MAKPIEQRVGGPNSTSALTDKGMSAPGDLSHVKKVGVRVLEGDDWSYKLVSVKGRAVREDPSKPEQLRTFFIPTNKELKKLHGKVWEIFPYTEENLDGKQQTTPIASVIESASEKFGAFENASPQPLPFAHEVDIFIQSLETRINVEREAPFKQFKAIVKPYFQEIITKEIEDTHKKAAEHKAIMEKKKAIVKNQIDAILIEKFTQDDYEQVEEDGRLAEQKNQLRRWNSGNECA